MEWMALTDIEFGLIRTNCSYSFNHLEIEDCSNCTGNSKTEKFIR